MLDLARESGEDAGLAVLRGDHAVIIDWVYGPHPLKIIEPFSETVTLNCAFRKVLLAFQGDKWVKAYIQGTDFPRYTPYTVTDPDRIWDEVQAIRRQRRAISRAENIADAGSVAAPVFAATGEIVATVFVTCPLSRFADEDVGRLAGSVDVAGREISGRLQAAGLSRQALIAHAP